MTIQLDSRFEMAALAHWMKIDPATAANWPALQPDATERKFTVVARSRSV